MAERDLEALVRAAADGDRDAQEHLLKSFWPVIRAAVRGRRGRLPPAARARLDTADLEQEAALRLLQGLGGHNFRGVSAFAAWVRKLTDHLVLDLHRRQHAQKRDAAADTRISAHDIELQSRSPESRLDEVAAADALLAELARLKPEYGAALMLHHFGFSMAEIGETLGCSTEAARKLVSRARLRLLALRGEQQ